MMVNLNIRIDKELREDFRRCCDDIGLTMTAAFNAFARAVVREQRIPFEMRSGKPSAEKQDEKIAS